MAAGSRLVLLYGQALLGSKVWFNGRQLRLNADGRFVFGRIATRRTSRSCSWCSCRTSCRPLSLKTKVAKREYDIRHRGLLPKMLVTPPASVTARIEKDQALAAAARKRDSDLDGFAEKFIWPCVGRISGVFGSQRILNGEAKQPHYGVDVAVPTGTPVYAPASGAVSLAEKDMYYTGGTPTIDHGHGLADLPAPVEAARKARPDGQAGRPDCRCRRDRPGNRPASRLARQLVRCAR